MTTQRLLAIGFIFVCTAVAWSILGATVVGRTGELDGRLSQEVAQLWGGRHVQVAPLVSVRRPREVTEEVKEQDAKGGTVVRTVKRTVIEDAPFPAASSRVRVDLGLDHRRKGLLWYDTYAVDFAGGLPLRQPGPRGARSRRPVRLPVDGGDLRRLPLQPRRTTGAAHHGPRRGLTRDRRLAPGEEAIAGWPTGRAAWASGPTPSAGRGRQVRDFALTMTTDFDGIDFPAGHDLAHRARATGEGCRLTWRSRASSRGSGSGWIRRTG